MAISIYLTFTLLYVGAQSRKCNGHGPLDDGMFDVNKANYRVLMSLSQRLLSRHPGIK